MAARKVHTLENSCSIQRPHLDHVVQLVEQRTVNPYVAGSFPAVVVPFKKE